MANSGSGQFSDDAQPDKFTSSGYGKLILTIYSPYICYCNSCFESFSKPIFLGRENQPPSFSRLAPLPLYFLRRAF